MMSPTPTPPKRLSGNWFRLSGDEAAGGRVGAGRRIVAPSRHAVRVEYRFDAELWIWDARRADSWTFASVPVDVSDEIREVSDGPPRGFGSVRVEVTIGGSTWRTSIFPDGGRGCYVLPVKRAVRKAEAVEAGDVATVTVRLLDV